MEMVWSKNLSSFLIWLKIGGKTAEAICNINRSLVQELIEYSFGGSRAWKGRSLVVGHRKLTMSNEEHSLELILLFDSRSCQRAQCEPYKLFKYLRQIGKVKRFDKWVSHDWTEKKKRKFKLFSIVIPLNLQNNKPFLIKIMTCNKKWIVLDNQWWPVQWLDQEAPKHFPKPNLYQKKVRDNCLAVCCWSDTLKLLNSGTPLCLWFVTRKLMRYSTKNCDAWSQHWPIGRPWNKQTFFIGKNTLTITVPILINKVWLNPVMT